MFHFMKEKFKIVSILQATCFKIWNQINFWNVPLKYRSPSVLLVFYRRMFFTAMSRSRGMLTLHYGCYHFLFSCYRILRLNGCTLISHSWLLVIDFWKVHRCLGSNSKRNSVLTKAIYWRFHIVQQNTVSVYDHLNRNSYNQNRCTFGIVD